MNLKDRVVVITGAGSGIGRATALAFAAEGARIAACDIDDKRLEALATELGDRTLLVRRVDVSDRLAMKLFADAVHDLVPAADIVVNNAGVACGGSFLDMSLDDWNWLLGINLTGVVHGCHFFIPKMVARGTGGHVINLSSILGIYPSPQLSAYVASKFAVRGFSQSLRAELARHKIGVTAICPGLIATQIAADSRLAGGITRRKTSVVDTFRERGAPPAKVAAAILDAVHSNPAVRTVGADARVIAALQRVAPRVLSRFAGSIQHRLGV